MNDAYHSDYSAISKTMLNLFVEDQELFYWTYVECEIPPKEPTPPMLAGQVLHAIILEDASIDDMVRCYPKSCMQSNQTSLNGKKAKVFRAENPGVICMKEQSYEGVRSVVDAVLANPKLQAILEQATGREKRHDAVIAGVPSKCKPDLECIGRRIALFDLKFSPVIHSRAWKRTSRSLRWWLQDCHYSAVVEEETGKTVWEFNFVSCELKKPYRIAVRHFNPISREQSRSVHLEYMKQLAECRRTGKWDVDLDEEIVLEPWDMDGGEETEEPAAGNPPTEDFDFDNGGE